MSTGRDFQGKVAIVTGSARNLGRAYAEALAAAGADVVVHHHSESSGDAAQETASLVSKKGRRAVTYCGDLAVVAQSRGLFDQAIAAFGRVDIVINNAGLIVKKPLVEVTEEEFDRSFGVNAKAAFFVMQEAAKCIADQGRIINMGTSLLAATTANYSVYAGSKAPLEDFTRALAWEIAPRGVTVNTICPGGVETPFFHGQETDASYEYAKAHHAFGRLARIEDIVPIVMFVASPEAQWVTAQTIFVNGGYNAR